MYEENSEMKEPLAALAITRNGNKEKRDGPETEHGFAEGSTIKWITAFFEGI